MSFDIKLSGIARTLTEDQGIDGCIVICSEGSDVRVGYYGLTHEATRETLCLAIHGSYNFEELESLL